MKALFFFALQWLGINRLFRWHYRGRVKTLLFHRVLERVENYPNAIAAAEFDLQIRELKRHHNVIGLNRTGDISGYRRDKVNVLITFDDGFEDNYRVAYPILLKHGATACFFVIANCIARGEPPSFAKRYMVSEGSDDGFRTVTANQIAEMAAAGMTIGSHSLDHSNYQKATFEQGVIDAQQAKAVLEEQLKMEIGDFAFPWGFCHPGQAEAIKRFYRRIYTTEHGFNDPGDWLIRRSEVANTYHMYAAASGALDWFGHLLLSRKVKV